MLPIFFGILFANFMPIFATFDDSFSREKIWPMAASAYSDNPGACVKDNFDNATYKRQIIVECDKEVVDTCAGFTAVSYSDQAIIVSFRGSEVLSFEVINEFLSALFVNKTAFPGGHGQVSAYFYTAFLDIWNGGLKDDFFTWKNANPTYEIWVTGHSLGAALASLCSGYLTTMGYVPADKLKLLTFGQPRVGDMPYANFIDQTLPFSYRVVHKADIVPHLPPLQLENIGDLSNYTHHQSEIWYNNSMTKDEGYTECDANESRQCSDQLESIYNDIFVLNWADHIFYYDDIAIYSYDGCPRNKTAMGYHPKMVKNLRKKILKT